MKKIYRTRVGFCGDLKNHENWKTKLHLRIEGVFTENAWTLKIFRLH